MGCDIHTHAERKIGDKYERIADMEPFDWRSYGMFGFLAGVRNYSDITPLSPPRGLPGNLSHDVAEDYESWQSDAHNASWLSVDELARFEYNQPMEDRRVIVQLAENLWSGAGTADAGGGEVTTYREFLGDAFFDDLEKLKAAGADRVVFWFDC